MQMMRTSASPIPFAPSNSEEMTAAVAADIGLPVIPSEAAIVDTDRGRSGRIPEFLEISAMMGISE